MSIDHLHHADELAALVTDRPHQSHFTMGMPTMSSKPFSAADVSEEQTQRFAMWQTGHFACGQLVALVSIGQSSRPIYEH
jgi:hypothetical protein